MKVGLFNILGHAISGVESCFVIPELKAVFDIGVCPSEATKHQTVFVTHGHPDHMAAAVTHAAIRSMVNQKPSRFVVPSCLVGPLTEMFALWNSFQPHAIEAEIIGLDPGTRFKLGKGLEVEAFKTDHTMPSQGYVVFERKQKLKEEYAGLPGLEIGRLRREGTKVTYTVETPIFAYTGDTRPSVFEDTPVLLKVEVLLTEATFVNEDYTSDFACERGHTHLEQLEGVNFGEHQHLVLTHFSQRHKQEAVKNAIDNFMCSALNVYATSKD